LSGNKTFVTVITSLFRTWLIYMCKINGLSRTMQYMNGAWVCEWYFLNGKQAIFQPYYGENKF